MGGTSPIEFRAAAILNGKGKAWSSRRKRLANAILRAYLRIHRWPRGSYTFCDSHVWALFPLEPPIQKTCEEMAGHFDRYLESMEIERPQHESGTVALKTA